ncbi:hypothetical protein CDAR_309341 [Caerostris darwini]|uniref:Uncharacterized protein n=1 Tax=Caerostris darwini TaxID=1538125 RepID=A0AAV4WPA9_9ARAC|nr:hypothetical protein CDAR_309341 [Caerostris darwini]
MLFSVYRTTRRSLSLRRKPFQATMTSSSIVTFSHVEMNQNVTSRRLPAVSSNPYNPLEEMKSSFKSVYRVSHLETFHTYKRGKRNIFL